MTKVNLIDIGKRDDHQPSTVIGSDDWIVVQAPNGMFYEVTEIWTIDGRTDDPDEGPGRISHHLRLAETSLAEQVASEAGDDDE